MNKSNLFELIAELAEKNGGRPPGIRAFYAATGIRESSWKNKDWNSWNNWGDVLEDAGFGRLKATTSFGPEHVLTQLALLTRKNGRFPVTLDMRREKRQNETFPNDKVITNAFGTREGALGALITFCQTREGYSDILPTLKSTNVSAGFPKLSSSDTIEGNSAGVNGIDSPAGFVYLLRTGRYYKLGFTTAPFHRFSTLIKQSPMGGEPIHHFATDDPRGIEKYWQFRFESRKVKSENKLSGEFYELSAADIAAFKKRKKFM